MPIGAFHRQTDRDPMPLGQQAAFDAGLAPVGGIGPRFFPAQAAPWSSPHPSPASPTRCRAAHQIARRPLAIISERRPLPPRPETDHAPWNARTLGLVQGLPLAARAQHIEDGIGADAIGHARSSAAKAMGIDVDGQERLEHGPEIIRDAKPGGGAIIGSAYALALGSLGASFMPQSIPGYSDIKN